MSTQQEKDYIKAMAEWGRECARWQLAHPDLDLVTELGKVNTDDVGGDHPPPPPPHP